MSDTTRQVLDIAYRVLFYTLWIAIPIIVLIILMYAYEKYKKWKDADRKEAERIIVKMNEDIVKSGTTINVLQSRETELKLAVDALEARLKELKKESGENSSDEASDDAKNQATITDSKTTIKDLHALAKERKIKGFSRMKKEDLIKILGQ
ncbi:MAG TPA: Rho termination factor N-terminal domain-containing protein [Acholeplasmataceae bacterium]|nr:Rho termination factor N-terminal domain-containing protein [Acholeplasmataceae bacterium]